MTRIPKRCKIRRTTDYERIFREGRRLRGQWMTIVVRPDPSADPPRVGLAVGKKIGKAHDRNRAKRLIRESLRLQFASLPRGWEIVVVAKEGIHKRNRREIDQEIQTLLQKLSSVMAKP